MLKLSDTAQAYQGQILHFVDDPAIAGENAWRYFENGTLVVDNGYVVAVGYSKELQAQLPETLKITVFKNHLITPGFIDTHIHYPQTEIIGAYGEQLLEWLSTYTFPAELKFSDKAYAKRISSFFLDELLRNGTTSALVFGTSHKNSIDAFFEEAQTRRLRMIAGKVLMDRHAPDELCDTAESGYEDSRKLIERWHGVDRLQYAVTPRFAPTSTPEQLQKAGELLQDYNDLYMHTHLSENHDEIAWVKELFPESKHYLDVYDNAGLLSRRSVFAHSIHLCDDEYKRLSTSGSGVAHCPTSNLFLGSGLLDLKKMQKFSINLGLGTDVGGGTSFSMFNTMGDAYKIQQLRENKLDPMQAFYLATLGGARVLDLENTIGNFTPGNEADFIVLDLQATPLLKFRLPYCQSLRDILFVLNTLGDDRVIERTYALGQCVYQRD